LYPAKGGNITTGRCTYRTSNSSFNSQDVSKKSYAEERDDDKHVMSTPNFRQGFSTPPHENRRKKVRNRETTPLENREKKQPLIWLSGGKYQSHGERKDTIDIEELVEAAEKLKSATRVQ